MLTNDEAVNFVEVAFQFKDKRFANNAFINAFPYLNDEQIKRLFIKLTEITSINSYYFDTPNNIYKSYKRIIRKDKTISEFGFAFCKYYNDDYPIKIHLKNLKKEDDILEFVLNNFDTFPIQYTLDLKTVGPKTFEALYKKSKNNIIIRESCLRSEKCPRACYEMATKSTSIDLIYAAISSKALPEDLITHFASRYIKLCLITGYEYEERFLPEKVKKELERLRSIVDIMS